MTVGGSDTTGVKKKVLMTLSENGQGREGEGVDRRVGN